MKAAWLGGAITLAAAVALGFAGWIQPANVFAFVSALSFCQ